jgi:hypothetical protein
MPSRPTTQPDRPRVGRREGLTLGLVVAVFALVLGLWAVLVPPFQAPDEKAHFDTALHLAIGDAWVGPGDQRFLNAVQAAAGQAAAGTDAVPAASRATVQELRAAHPGFDVGAVDQMTQHPPTAYLLQAVVLRVVGFEHLRWDHALLALRLFDALVVLPLPVLAWAAVRRLTRSPRAAVVGAAAVLAVPELASIAASVTNDALTMTLGGLVTAVLVLALTGDRRPRVLLSLGIALGLLVITKGTGLPAVPVVALALLLGPGAPAWGRRLVETAGVLLLAGAVGGWWWVRNLVRYGTLQPDGYAAIRPPRSFPAGQGPDMLTFVDVSWGTVIRTFWGSFGVNAFAAMSPWLLVPLTLLTVGTVAVLAFRRGPARRAAVLLAVFPVLLLAAQTVTSIHGYLTTTSVVGTQGRYLFPSVVALIVLSAVAWRRLPLGARAFRVLPAVLATGAVVLAAVGLGTARVRLVPGVGYAVWSDAALGGIATGLLAVLALLTAVPMVIRVARMPSTPRTGADSQAHPPR